MNAIMMVFGTLLMVLGTIFFLLILIIATMMAIFLQFSRILQQKITKKIENGDINKETLFGSRSSYFVSFMSDVFSDLPFVGNFLKKQLDSCKECADYLDSLMPKILHGWNSRELVVRATPQFLDSLEAGEPEKSFESHWNNLGQLKVYKGIKRFSGENYFNEATFFTEATFEKGLAEIQLQLIQDDNKWLINNFKVIYLFLLTAQA